MNPGRYCRTCGAGLPAADPCLTCSTCRRRAELIAENIPPKVPAAFWDHDEMVRALLGEHMGAVIRAYRRHPHHGPRPLPQETVARWAGLSQPQLSRIEKVGVLYFDSLVQWARLLGIPRDRLWFHVPDGRAEEDDVRRKQFLKIAGVTAMAAATGTLGELSAGDAAAEDLAWELWQQRRPALHPSELARELAAAAARDVAAGSPWIVLDDDGCYALAHPTLVDVFVARRIFGGISHSDPSLFASAQTSHETDQVLRRYVAQDDEHVRVVTAWMTRHPDPVLRVNAAGVLGKLNRPDATTGVIDALRRDVDTRRKYVTAVAARVLGIEWQAAESMASEAEAAASGASCRWSPGETANLGTRLAQETQNPRDGAARWCALVLLGGCGEPGRDVADALQRALRTEPIAENLRAIGTVLAGSSPLTV